ncbi:male-specific lethal 1-like 1 [Oscarella lobularis]|uniref:male-specific lethal 1-like 1 n=1 Tax=Oscarella lobularis TaxID=121494 RepID=UPI003313E0C0
MATHRRTESATNANSSSTDVVTQATPNGNETHSKQSSNAAADSRTTLPSTERLLHATSRLSKRSTTTAFAGGSGARAPSPDLAPNQQQIAMKRLLLLHLELIQQQQEQLQAKDREIAQLTAQKEQIQAKFVRIERRLSLQQRRNASARDETRSFATHGRKYHYDGIPDDTLDYTPPRRKSIAINRERDYNEDSTASSPSVTDFRMYELSCNYLTTSTPYSSAISSQEEEDLNNEVEVPPWREVPAASGNNSNNREDTEDLDDAVFLKRHHKHEIEEKRIKRWDVQRARQKMREEALKKHYQSNSHLWNTPTQSPQKSEGGKRQTFFPSLDKVKFIEVTDKIPVMAFGELLPILEPRDFELPWFDASNQRTDSQKTKKAKAKLKYRNI